MKLIHALVLVLVSTLPPAAQAVIETYEFSDSDLEQRYHDLSQELRCPKCQNQNIADSNAPISQDLRKLLYEQLEAGASDEEILDYMVARYGEFVRYRPSFNSATAVLWFAPLFLLLAGVVVAVLALRSRPAATGSGGSGLSDEEEQRLRTLLREGDDDNGGATP